MTCAGGVMLLSDLREPINAWSHGAGMMLALPVTWILLKLCADADCHDNLRQWGRSRRYQRIKALCLLVFGVTLILCYGISAFSMPSSSAANRSSASSGSTTWESTS